MPQRRRARTAQELLSRSIEVSGFSAAVSVRALHLRGEEPHIEGGPCLELRGTVPEAVRGVQDVRISVFPTDNMQVGTARPASVGALIQASPELSFVLTCPRADFDRVWALAAGGHLNHGHLCFTRPHYSRGLLVSASFSNESEG